MSTVGQVLFSFFEDHLEGAEGTAPRLYKELPGHD